MAQPKAQTKPQQKAPKPPATLLLIRHAETATTGKVLPGRAAGLALSPKGIGQAEATAEAVAARHKIAAIYSSPMERACQTAEPLSRIIRRQIRIHPGLNECEFGRWTGRRLSALRKSPAWRQVQLNPSNFRFPEGESFPEMQNRMVNSLLEIAQTHRGKTVAVFSHADTIKAAVAHTLGVHLDLFQRIIISPASVTVIQLGEDGPAVLGINHSY